MNAKSILVFAFTLSSTIFGWHVGNVVLRPDPIVNIIAHHCDVEQQVGGCIKHD